MLRYHVNPIRTLSLKELSLLKFGIHHGLIDYNIKDVERREEYLKYGVNPIDPRTGIPYKWNKLESIKEEFKVSFNDCPNAKFKFLDPYKARNIYRNLYRSVPYTLIRGKGLNSRICGLAKGYRTPFYGHVVIAYSIPLKEYILSEYDINDTFSWCLDSYLLQRIAKHLGINCPYKNEIDKTDLLAMIIKKKKLWKTKSI